MWEAMFAYIKMQLRMAKIFLKNSTSMSFVAPEENDWLSNWDRTQVEYFTELSNNLTQSLLDLTLQTFIIVVIWTYNNTVWLSAACC